MVVKLKTAGFQILTRSHTPGTTIASAEELVGIAIGLMERIELAPETTYRLVGVGLGGFVDLDDPLQPTLFGTDDADPDALGCCAHAPRHEDG